MNPTNEPQSARLWDKGAQVDEVFLRFTSGTDELLDQRLIPYDVQGSLAHVAMLEASNWLVPENAESLRAGLATVLEEWKAGSFSVLPGEEDSHTAIERRLTQICGDVGASIHLGRSRNDQVVTMVRLAMRDFLRSFCAQLAECIEALVTLAERERGVPLPGYTHLQRAMPSSASVWALGYAELLIERREAALALWKQLARSALGSASGYGVPIPLRRDVAALNQNCEDSQVVTAVQLTRGLDELAFCQWAQLVAIVVGRLAFDVTLFASQDLGFVALDDAITSGSSIMPNKRNPDLFELLRAHGTRFGGYTTSISGVIAGLPGGYHRDLQLVKESLMAASDDLRGMLEALARGISGLRFNPQACQAAMSAELYATAYACELVREEGLPFREAYRRAAQDKSQWVVRPDHLDADAASNPAYAERVIAALRKRLHG